VPESRRWQRERASGATSHWATADLLGVLIGACGPALMIAAWASPDVSLIWRVAAAVVGVAVATVGYSYPVAQYLRRLNRAPGAAPPARVLPRMGLAAVLSGIVLLGTWGSAQWAAAWADKLTAGAQNSREWTQIWLAAGAIVGTILAAQMGDWLGRRVTYALMCGLSLAASLGFYLLNPEFGGPFLAWGFFMGLCTASFYGWLPLYLPELFGTNVRATGQGFGFNFGRILAAVGTLQTGAMFDGKAVLFGRPLEGYPLACSTMSLIYLLGLVVIWFAPETKGKSLPE
jgi:MFS transporter, SHS family, sialic acid transporter